MKGDGFFDDTLNRNYCGLALEAFVATPDFYPRENAAFQTLKVRFKETTKVDLFESREKRYFYPGGIAWGGV